MFNSYLNNVWLIGSILIGVGLVVAAWYITESRNGSGQSSPAPMRTQAAYTYGAANAPITIVEWSDAECPFCARVHPTLTRLVDESEGTIRWQYRHLTLRAGGVAAAAAVAAECVGKHVGETAFWDFLDTVFSNQDRLDQTYLSSRVTAAGVSEAQYQACQNDESIAALIAQDTAAAEYFGGSGTPFSLIIFPDNTIRPVSGALPYEQWLTLLDRE